MLPEHSIEVAFWNMQLGGLQMNYGYPDRKSDQSMLVQITEEYQPIVEVLRTKRGSMTNYNYLVVDSFSRRAVIVDPAWQMDVVEHAMSQAQASLEGVLLTHAHADHVDLAGVLSEKYGCPVWMSTREIEASGFSAANLVGIDESDWWIGGMKITPILTPGHTPGCFCYLIGDNLFTGDVLFVEGCGICPDVESAYQMFESLQRLKREIKPETRIFPGHSFGKAPGLNFTGVIRENIYLHFRDKKRFAEFRQRHVHNREKFFEFH
ncbi:MAG: MBL fold metallo-hydrolase [Xanthomonadales bacterium]|nr:MBL fold metallo-hydrolase [Xanthomonadales bacterium]